MSDRYYCIDQQESGYDPCDIRLQLYKSDDFTTIAIRKDELYPRKIAEALNNAYRAGRNDAMQDLRNFIGIKI